MSLVDMRDGVLTRTLDGMTGSKNKAGAFVRRHVIPTDPKSTDQLNRRARMKELGIVVRQAHDRGVHTTIYPVLEKTTYWAFCMSISKPYLSAASSNPNLYSLISGSLWTPGLKIYEIFESTGQIKIRWERIKAGELTGDTLIKALFWNEDRGDMIVSPAYDINDVPQFVAHNWSAGETVFMELWAYNEGVSTSPPRKAATTIFA